MGLEAGTYLNDLVTTNPVGAGDSKSAGDDHIRLVKTVLKNTFPNMAGRVQRSQAKTSSYSAVANDNLSAIVFTAGTTPTLDTAVAASSLGNGWHIACINVSGSTVTFDPNGSETVNGASTLTISDDQVAFIWCDGSNFYALLVPLTPPSSSQAVPTGVVFPYCGTTAPSGYVLAAGKTVGSGSSGATERANADTETLYTLLWGQYANTELAIQDSSGSPTTRGASAAADFAANKRLPVPDMRGRLWAVKDDLGGTAASRLTSATVDGTVMGKAGGAQTHTLALSESPAHDHSGSSVSGSTDSGGSHTHTANAGHAPSGGGSALTRVATGSTVVVNNDSGTTFDLGVSVVSGGSHTHTITGASLSIASQGGGGAHANVQPTIVGGAIIKL